MASTIDCPKCGYSIEIDSVNSRKYWAYCIECEQEYEILIQDKEED